MWAGGSFTEAAATELTDRHALVNGLLADQAAPKAS